MKGADHRIDMKHIGRKGKQELAPVAELYPPQGQWVGGVIFVALYLVGRLLAYFGGD